MNALHVVPEPRRRRWWLWLWLAIGLLAGATAGYAWWAHEMLVVGAPCACAAAVHAAPATATPRYPGLPDVGLAPEPGR